MILNYLSTIQSIHGLTPGAQNLGDDRMEQREITVHYNGQDYLVRVMITYAGIDTIIKATTGDTELEFVPAESGGIDIKQSGEPLEEGLINKITMEVLRALE